MRTARDVALFFRRYTVQMLRNPIWLFVGFSTPLLYLVLFTPLLKHELSVQGIRTTNVLDISCQGSCPCSLSQAAWAPGSALSSSSRRASSSASG